MPLVRDVSESTLTIDGVTAFDRIYQRPRVAPWKKVSDIWLEKGEVIYVISC